MLEWRDTGMLLSVRRHGETAAIAEVFTRDHGRHLGVVRGGGSRKQAPVLQPGTQLDLTWSARLEDHLGSFRVEPVVERASALMADRVALAGLNSVCALLGFALPERSAHGRLYDFTISLVDAMAAGQGWWPVYVLWERMLLEDTGHGLHLDQCAVSGGTQELVYVSPKSGRAVSRAHAGEWADRLLPLPPVLAGDTDDLDGIMDGLRTTGYFLTSHLAPALGNDPLPQARERLITVLGRALARDEGEGQ